MLAYDVFIHRLRREIGAMAASAGGLDVLVMTGGIGEHSPEVRADTAVGLGHLGVVVNTSRNQEASPDVDVSDDAARVRTLVVAASEESEVARETRRVLEG